MYCLVRSPLKIFQQSVRISVEIVLNAVVVKAIAIMVLGIAFGCLYAVAFVPEDATLAPIDAVLLEILKAIAFMGVGSMGTVAGRKGVSAVAQMIAGDQQ